MKSALLAAIAATFLSSAVYGATASETGAPGGDYANTFGASSNFLNPLPVGFSDVTGRIFSTPSDTFDAFYVTIAPGTELIFAEISFEAGNPSVVPNMTAKLLDSLGGTVFDMILPGNGSFTLIDYADPPLAPGIYNFGLGFESVSAEVFWSITSEVQSTAPVPLPAGLPLLLAGFGALGLMTRKRG